MKKIFYTALVLFLLTKSIYAQEQYIGEIRLFAGNFAPKGWALCQGQLLPINQNQALFSLLGTTYGGDGRTTFALPDYRGRAAVSASSVYQQGVKTGTENITITATNLPAHSHSEPLKVSSAKAAANAPTANSSIASPAITVNSATRDILGYNTASPNTPLLGTTSTTAGSTTPTAINIMQPSIVLTYIIALQGIFPSQN
ncbi:phage tail protein [Flavobacterium nackdongense]|uniref:Phage tail protein n=1 Tax=Flavobacterium nackdongense TaxID=2547394 RepID=A0A4P6YGU7_9FLAO|nr:tail fiber protein [Flavobacterium nackdongense]QBN20164.1 phage tail protein [Flavobacterium nackdongense]